MDEGVFRLLIADDEKAIIQSLKRVLRNIAPGVEVLAATSGVDALFMIAEEKPDAALVDLHLKDVDGVELLRAVSARKSLAGVKLVAMAVSVNATIAAKAQKAGALRCLRKPVDARELVSLLRLPISRHGPH